MKYTSPRSVSLRPSALSDTKAYSENGPNSGSASQWLYRYQVFFRELIIFALVVRFLSHSFPWRLMSQCSLRSSPYFFWLLMVLFHSVVHDATLCFPHFYLTTSHANASNDHGRRRLAVFRSAHPKWCSPVQLHHNLCAQPPSQNGGDRRPWTSATVIINVCLVT